MTTRLIGVLGVALFIATTYYTQFCLQTYWLLLAISQDQQRNKHIASLRDRCEQAALNGYWVSSSLGVNG